MTKKIREYAKSRIEYLLKVSRLDERDKEALEAAIKALSQEPIDCANAEHDADGCLGYSTDRGGYSYCQTCLECPKASINNRDKEQEPCDECRNKRSSFCGNCKEYDEFEPCADAVCRKAVIEAITKHMDGEDKNCKLQLLSVVEWIRDLPPVTQKSDEQLYKNGFADGYEQGHKDAEQKSGKWIDIEDSNFSKCSECGAETPMYFDPYGHGKGITVVETSYCPNCGAKMESEDKE